MVLQRFEDGIRATGDFEWAALARRWPIMTNRMWRVNLRARLAPQTALHIATAFGP